MRYLFFCIIFLMGAYAKPLHIDDSFKSQNGIPYIEYIETNETEITAIKDKEFAPLTAENLRHPKGNIWTKLVIKNTSDSKKEIVITNPRAGMDFVDMYTFKEDKLVSSHLMGDNRSFYDRPLHSRHSGIKVSMEPKEQLVIYTKLKNKGPMFADMAIHSEVDFIGHETYELLWYGFAFAVMLVVIIYSSFIVLSLRRHIFVWYIVHISSALMFYASVNGMIFYVSGGALYGLGEFLAHYGMLICAASVLYFDLLFFRLRYISPLVYKAGLFFIFLATFSTSSTILYQYFSFIGVFLPFTPIMSFVAYIYSIFLLIYVSIKKLPFAKLYLVGHSLYLSGMLIYVEFILGALPRSVFTEQAGIFGIILEGIVIAFAINQMIKENFADKQRAESLLKAHSRFMSIGKQLASIVHQWKIPLNRLSSIAMYIESTLSKDTPDIKKLQESVPKLNDTIAFLDNTVTSFYDFYRTDAESHRFKIANELNKIIEMLRPLLDGNHITISNDCDDTLELDTKLHIFDHVLLILIQNAMGVLSKSEQTSRIITLSTLSIDNKIRLTVSDNGGGMEPKILSKIFEGNALSDNGLGLGLPLAHFLVKEQLGGEIRGYNDKEGAAFEIVLSL